MEEIRSVGRPTLLTSNVRGSIVSELQRDEFSTARGIASAIAGNGTESVSVRTVRRYLTSLGYRNSLPRIMPFITEAQKVKRVQWAQAHNDLDWNKVFFSDETTIQLSANITRAWHKNESRPICKKKQISCESDVLGCYRGIQKEPVTSHFGKFERQGVSSPFGRGVPTLVSTPTRRYPDVSTGQRTSTHCEVDKGVLCIAKC